MNLHHLNKILFYGCRITLITHTSLKNHVDYIKDLKNNGHRLMLLIDEAHACQSPKSKFYQLVMSIRPYFSIVHLMTATPLKNNIERIILYDSYFKS